MRSFLFILILFCSCNDADDLAPKIEKQNTQEQALLNEIAANPDSSILVESLVQYYREENDYSKALNIVQKQIKKDSLADRWWNIQATLQFEKNDTLGAIHSFENAINIFAAPQYIIPLATLYAQTKNKKSLILADALIKGKANVDKEAYFVKGLFYSYSGDKLKAIEYFDKCLAISYTYMSAYTEKALALYDLQKYTDALLVLDKALTLQNNYDEGYYYRGQCLEKLNKIPEAIEAYNMALMYDPQYEEAKDALSRLENKK